MRVDANPAAVQFAMLSRNSGQIQKLQPLNSATTASARHIDGNQFVIRSRAEIRAEQQTQRVAHRPEKAAQIQQPSAQLPSRASLSGLEHGGRFQPDFTKVAAKTQKSAADILIKATETPKAPVVPQAASTSGTTDSASVFGQAQLDAINKFFGTQSGDRGFETSVDYNSDGSIDFSDITYVLSKWGEALPPNQQAIPQPDLTGPFGQKHLDAVNELFGKALGDDGFLAQADANGDGTIGFSDITHILSNWGQPTGSGTL